MPEVRSSNQARLAAAGVSDVGRTREINEDNILVKRDLDLFVVADGMGGHSAGDVASSIATASLVSFFQALHDGGAPDAGPMSDNGLPRPAQALVNAIKKANQEIHARSTSSVQHKGMGSTIVAMLVSRDTRHIHIAHVGDSRCYRIRDGNIEQMTRDHSLINEALALKPDLTKAQIARLPKNVITRALGMSAVVQVDVRSEELRIGDTFLLCSDGLSGLVPDEKILDIVDISADVQEACELLVDEANEAGGTDNISALMIRVEDGERDSAPIVEVKSSRRDDDEAAISVQSEPIDEDLEELEPPPAQRPTSLGADSAPTLAAKREDIARLVAEAAEVEVSAEPVEMADLYEDDFASLGFDAGGEEDFLGQEELDPSFADSFVSEHIVESFGLVDDEPAPMSMARVARCKRCSFELFIGNKFCVECGARIET